MNITKALHNVHDIHSFFSLSLHNLEICFLIILSLHNVCKALFHYLRPGSGYCRNLFLVAVISSKGLLKLYVSDFVCFGVFFAANATCSLSSHKDFRCKFSYI